MLISPVSLPAAPASYELTSPENLPSDQAAAKKLEGLFLSMLIKEMRESSTEDGLFAGDDAGVQGGIFDMMMGEYLAEQNAGLGISRYLLAAQGSQSPAGDTGSSSSEPAPPPTE